MLTHPVDASIRVRYAETDQMGIAYYGNYLAWFEVGRVEWCKAQGFNYRDMEKDDGAFLVVVEARCRYRAPARFDDLVTIRTVLKQARRSVLIFEYQVLNQETGQLLATGETVHVVTGKDLRKRSLPEKYLSLFGLEKS